MSEEGSKETGGREASKEGASSTSSRHESGGPAKSLPERLFGPLGLSIIGVLFGIACTLVGIVHNNIRTEIKDLKAENKSLQDRIEKAQLDALASKLEQLRSDFDGFKTDPSLLLKVEAISKEASDFDKRLALQERDIEENKKLIEKIHSEHEIMKKDIAQHSTGLDDLCVAVGRQLNYSTKRCHPSS